MTPPNAPELTRSLTRLKRAAMNRSPATVSVQERDEFEHA